MCKRELLLVKELFLTLLCEGSVSDRGALNAGWYPSCGLRGNLGPVQWGVSSVHT